MTEILKTDHITKKFNPIEIALREVTLGFDAGTFTVILGQSGSGKSTLLQIMSGLRSPTDGAVYYNGKDITAITGKEQLKLRQEKFSNIFQEYFLLPELTVRENIEMGNTSGNSGFSCEEVMEQLDIISLAGRFPYELSGGQRQRTAIARALVKNPDVLFCDEATGALDEVNSKNVVSYLREINRRYSTTVIFSTHNIKISRMADRVVTMKDGAVLSDVKNLNPLPVSEIDWGIEG